DIAAVAAAAALSSVSQAEANISVILEAEVRIAGYAAAAPDALGEDAVSPVAGSVEVRMIDDVNRRAVTGRAACAAQRKFAGETGSRCPAGVGPGAETLRFATAAAAALRKDSGCRVFASGRVAGIGDTDVSAVATAAGAG